MIAPASPSVSPWLDRALLLALALMLALMLGLSSDFGITWDEPDQQHYGEAVLRWWASGCTDTDALTFKLNYLNGGIFDVLSVATQKLWRLLQPEARLYDMRHACNSLVGWLAILGAALLGRRLFGPLAGLLAALFLFLSPRFFGDAMNNPKDIPFAAAGVWALYCLARLRPRYPYATPGVLAGIVASLAALLGIRAGGLLFFAFAAALLALYALRDPACRNCARAQRVLAVTVGAGIAALLLGELFWPWALRAPFTAPFLALKTISRYPWTGTLLFNGQAYFNQPPPWDYIPRLYAITSPLAVLAGGLAAPFLLFRRPDRAPLLALAFAALFPVAYVAFKQAMLYDGLRHLLFVYPPFAALSAAAWARLLERTRRRRWRVLLLALLALGIAHPLLFSLRNHPLEIVYYNELIGGTSGAAGKYDLDYWGVSYKSAVDWIRARERNSGRPTLVFAPEGELGGHLVAAYVAQFPELRFSADFQNADYNVFLNRLLFPETLASLQKTEKAHAVPVDGVPLCFATW
jgi:4-amino-4-deoxy-L-arabinose transferase-like glycosyltransferase